MFKSRILLTSRLNRVHLSYNQSSVSNSHPAGLVYWGRSLCVELSSGEVPPLRCDILISIHKPVLGIQHSPPFTRLAVASMIMSRTVLIGTETSSASCGISIPFAWERLIGIPSSIPAASFAGVWFEAEVPSDVCNGAIRTADYVFAPRMFSHRDAAAPHDSLCAFETV